MGRHDLGEVLGNSVLEQRRLHVVSQRVVVPQLPMKLYLEGPLSTSLGQKASAPAVNGATEVKAKPSRPRKDRRLHSWRLMGRSLSIISHWSLIRWKLQGTLDNRRRDLEWEMGCPGCGRAPPSLETWECGDRPDIAGRVFCQSR